MLVNVSVLYSAEELQYVLNKADVEVLLYEDALPSESRPPLRSCHGCATFKIGTVSDGDASWSQLLAGQPDTPPAMDIGEDDPFCMTYTGGTTGRPKGVLASHRARAVTAHTVVVESRIRRRRGGHRHPAVPRRRLEHHAAARGTGWRDGGALPEVGNQPVRAGVQATRHHGRIHGADPGQHGGLRSGFDADDYASWTKLNFSGAPMPDWVQRTMLEKLPQVRLTQFYGQSEMGIVAVLKHEDLPASWAAWPAGL